MNKLNFSLLSCSMLFLLIHSVEADPCSPKFQGFSLRDGSICNVLSQSSDTSWLIFDISLPRHSIDPRADTVQLAALRTAVKSLFAKYYLRSPYLPHERVAPSPDSSIIEYLIGNVEMTKATALKMAEDSSVARMDYRYEPLQTVSLSAKGISSSATRKSHSGINALGQSTGVRAQKPVMIFRK
jgi:hypothetical protein